MESLVIKAVFDDEARVWVANDDTLGLVAEADTVEVLEYKLQELIPELAELNGIDLPRPIRFTLVSERTLSAFA
jgi:hypothetical protein